MTDIVHQRGPTERLVAGSIYRLLGTESRKGNVSFSLDMQNATSVGGHWLQTEISSRSCSLGDGVGGAGKRGGTGGTGDKERERLGGTKRAYYILASAQSNVNKTERKK